MLQHLCVFQGCVSGRVSHAGTCLLRRRLRLSTRVVRVAGRVTVSPTPAPTVPTAPPATPTTDNTSSRTARTQTWPVRHLTLLNIYTKVHGKRVFLRWDWGHIPLSLRLRGIWPQSHLRRNDPKWSSPFAFAFNSCFFLLFNWRMFITRLYHHQLFTSSFRYFLCVCVCVCFFFCVWVCMCGYII